MEEETIVLKLEQQIAGPAGEAVASLQRLEQEIGSSADAVRELQAQMKVAQSGPVVDIGQFRALSASLDTAKVSASEAQQAYVAMGGSARDAMSVAKGGVDGLAKAEAKAAAEALKLAAAEKKAAEAGKAMGSAGATISSGMGSIVGGAAKAEEAVLGVNGSIKQLAPLAGPIAGKMTIFTDALSKLGPYGMAAAAGIIILGGAVAAYVGIVSKAISASAALQAKNAKASGDVKAQALSLGSQMAKFEKDVDNIFSGAQIEPFLSGLQSILSLFDGNSAMAKSLKATIADMTNAAIGGMLRVAIALVTSYTAIRNNAVAWAAVKAVAYGVLAIFALMVAGLAAVAAVAAGTLAVLAAPFIAAAAVAMAFWYAVKAVYAFITGLTWERVGELIVAALLLPITAGKALGEMIGAAFNAMMAVNWGAVGESIVAGFQAGLAFLAGLPATLANLAVAMIEGLVNGITAGAAAVASALSGVVSGGIKAAKAALGIASPSKVFTAMGENTTESYAGAVDDGAGDVAASTASMAKGGAVAAAAVPQGGAAGGSSSRSVTFDFSGAVFGSDVTKDKVREWFLDILEEAKLEGAA